MAKKGFQVRMADDLKAWLDNEAEKSGRSRNWLIEQACRQRMQRLERQRTQAAERRKARRRRK